ncbi:MAG: YeeE/YedE family protein [Kofleriaceae bacterium]|nr:YeeE/YedE family protein [Kofleriaceae bacterium]MCB9574596.1 YeeE/YedE family protein [Kofleriaceae bacterium]
MYPLAIGLTFGWLLHKAGLARYDRIVGVYRLRDLAVLELMLAALASAAIGVVGLGALGVADAVPVPTPALGAALIGGVVFGAGMALSGFCPGTIMVGVGEGRLDNLVAGSLGLIAGALAYGAAWPTLAPRLARLGDLGVTTLPRLLGVAPWLLALLLAEVAAGVLYLVVRPRRGAADAS